MKKTLYIAMLVTFTLSLFGPAQVVNAQSEEPTPSGVNASYEVEVTLDPEPALKIKATYENVSSPFQLDILGGVPNLSSLLDLQFHTSDGADLSWQKIDPDKLQIYTDQKSIVATYSIDLQQNTNRTAKVSVIGGAFSGYTTLLTPSNSTLSSARVKFSLPEPWVAVSSYPKEGDWFEIQPYTFENLVYETKASGWYYGILDYDQTFTYEDGFPIRVVGFKNFEYEHWNVYDGGTALDGAKESADFYYASIREMKSIFGECPLPQVTLIGPGYFQARNSYLIEQPVGWYRYEYIPHHVAHAYFGINTSRMSFTGNFDTYLAEGYSTYLEGILSEKISGEPYWRGMLYERKFHYIRGMKFNNMEQNSKTYVLGFITTYLLDKEINNRTQGQKGINDLMVALWNNYKNTNHVDVSDEEVLKTLKQLTGDDWHGFFQKNIVNTNHLDVNQLDDLKDDFRTFLEKVSDTWYNGYPSAYFVDQEILSAVGDFDFGCRMQSRYGQDSGIVKFAILAHKKMVSTKSDLTDQDVIEILEQITGKDHSDFFEFYAGQGFAINVEEINQFVRSFSFLYDASDNSILFSPSVVPTGGSTQVTGELVDPFYSSSAELLLQVQVYDLPEGISAPEKIITGSGVEYQFSQSYQDENNGTIINVIYRIPNVKIGDKSYTFFTFNLPEDAGIISYSIHAKGYGEPETNNWLGGYIGTEKVNFQSTVTFHFLEGSAETKDTIPPLVYVALTDAAKKKIEASPFCLSGQVEPGATVTINGVSANINQEDFSYQGCFDLQPGENIIKIVATDPAGNTSSQSVKLMFGSLTPIAPPSIEKHRSNIWVIVVLVVVGVGALAVLLAKKVKPRFKH